MTENPRIVDENADGVADQNEHGKPLLDFPMQDGYTARCALEEMIPPPLPPPPQIDPAEYIAQMQAKWAEDVATAHAEADRKVSEAERAAQRAADDAAERVRKIGDERDDLLDKLKKSKTMKWVSAVVGFMTAALILVVYFNIFKKQMTEQIGELTGNTSHVEAQEWLESVRYLLDEEDTDDDDYSRGRKALGLED